MVELGVCFFFRTSAMESLTAPVSLSYPSNDEDTKFMMDPGIDQFGVVLEIAVVESLYSRDLLQFHQG